MAAAELQQSIQLLEQRLLHQRSVLRNALSLSTEETFLNNSHPSFGPISTFPSPTGGTSPLVTPSIRHEQSSGTLRTPHPGSTYSTVRIPSSSFAQLKPSTAPQQFASPWVPQSAADVFSPAFVNAQKSAASLPSGPHSSPGVARADVGRTVLPNPAYVSRSNLVRNLVSRSSYKKAVKTSEESPEIVCFLRS
jgi:hypothetical protein